MEPNKKANDVTYWHPAFFADIQIELKDDADNLIFENEHQLGKKPMEIDVLIIKKEADRPVKKNIGRIFKKHNIIEYKGPGDSLSVDDFYKVYGYTCFYKADVPYVNSISVEDLTITFVSEKYPRELIRHLKTVKKYTLETVEAGIYSVKGDIIPIQIIVTKKLSATENLWLKSLTNNLKEAKNAEKLLDEYMKNSENGLYHAVLETIMQANRRTFREVNGMSDIFMEIVQEKFDRKLEEKVEERLREELPVRLQEKLQEELQVKLAEKVQEKLQEETEVWRKQAENARLLERISLVQKKFAKNKPLDVIAEEMETEQSELLSVYNIISQNPDKSAEEICELALC